MTGSYRVEWKRAAIKELRKLPRDMVGRLIEAADTLAVNPYPADAKKLTGAQNTFRLRAGSYRLIYTVAAAALIVEVVRVEHRKDVYDRI